MAKETKKKITIELKSCVTGTVRKTVCLSIPSFIPNWWCWRCISVGDWRVVLFQSKIEYWLIWFCFTSDFLYILIFMLKKSCAETCREYCVMLACAIPIIYATESMCNYVMLRGLTEEFSREWERWDSQSDRSQWNAILGCLVRLINNPIVNYKRQQCQSAKLFPWTYECLLLLIVSFCLQHWKW